MSGKGALPLVPPWCPAGVLWERGRRWASDLTHSPCLARSSWTGVVVRYVLDSHAGPHCRVVRSGGQIDNDSNELKAKAK